MKGTRCRPSQTTATYICPVKPKHNSLEDQIWAPTMNATQYATVFVGSTSKSYAHACLGLVSMNMLAGGQMRLSPE